MRGAAHATRGEVVDAIESGMPSLTEAVGDDSAALRELGITYAAAMSLVPAR